MLALLCSGQGRQHAGMFALTADVAAAAPLFAQATALLGGRDPRALVRSAATEELHVNRIGQILCGLQGLSAAAALSDVLSAPVVVAGYSVGEMAAWGISGLFSPADTLALVAQRAEVMDAVSPPGDGLLFVRGLDHNAVEGLCEKHGAAIAIINPGSAFVVGGNRAELRALAIEAQAMHAKRVVEVPVTVASHTPRLAAASTRFRANLCRYPLRSLPASERLLSGVDGTPVIDVRAGLDKLAQQISHTVQWTDCLQGCIEAGATAFLELGPGPALSRMVGSAYTGVPARCLDDFRTLDGVRSWLARQL